MPATDHGPNLLDLTLPELEALLQTMGHRPFRARQLWQWLWQKRARSVAEMTNLAKDLRAALAEQTRLAWPAEDAVRVSADGTVKFLLGLEDGERVETVLIPEKDHFTQCLSSQVGCSLRCTFCATGQMGLTRNLSHGEILGQILVARDYLARTGHPLALRNLVFMGMGEPFLNTDAVMAALQSMQESQGLSVSPRRITVSTAGIPQGIRRLGQSGLAHLAVSLHAPTQELRERIMPRAARVPLDELMACLREYPLKPRQRITFEYILLGGVNDRLEHARELVRLLSHVRGKVNLIVFNPPPDCDSPYQAPEPGDVEAFQGLLRDKNVTAMLRKSKGQDIHAACGQLKTALQRNKD
jgi:23S rRNA (adenine2503-C2)-methyltransferase